MHWTRNRELVLAKLIFKKNNENGMSQALLLVQEISAHWSVV